MTPQPPLTPLWNPNAIKINSFSHKSPKATNTPGELSTARIQAGASHSVEGLQALTNTSAATNKSHQGETERRLAQGGVLSYAYLLWM